MENGPNCSTVISSPLTMSRVSDARRSDDIAAVSSLILLILRGEAAAFEQLIVRYERRVFSLAMKLLGSTDDAEDAAQEVFLRMFKYIHRFDVQKPLQPWLLQ